MPALVQINENKNKSLSILMLQGAHEAGPQEEILPKITGLVTQKTTKGVQSANRQMARTVIHSYFQGSTRCQRLEDYDLFYLALNEHMIQSPKFYSIYPP